MTTIGAEIQEETEAFVLAKIGMTLRSAGQWLQVELADSDHAASEWRVSSWPTLQTTLLNWGESRRLVAQFISFVKKADSTVEDSADAGPG